MTHCTACEKPIEANSRFCPYCGAQVALIQAAGDDPYLGKLVSGKYMIERLLGEGGMGKVYKATQQPLEKPVVLKILHPSLQSDASLVARFQREARAASRLSHPNSIQVTDFGQMEDGALYIAMEYLEGRDLASEMARTGPFPEERLIRVTAQVLSALDDAHACGVIHRDLKPENVMIAPRRDDPDHVKVLDFGIAKLQDPRDGPDSVPLTQAGLVCGTPEYMSPEQARGEELDARSDIYAVGVLMYQLATGELPFKADSSIAIVTKHLTETPPSPRQLAPNLSEALESIILRCMAKEREARHPSALALREELRALLTQPTVESSHRIVAASAGLPSAVDPAPLPASLGEANLPPVLSGECLDGKPRGSGVRLAPLLLVAAGGLLLVSLSAVAVFLLWSGTGATLLSRDGAEGALIEPKDRATERETVAREQTSAPDAAIRDSAEAGLDGPDAAPADRGEAIETKVEQTGPAETEAAPPGLARQVAIIDGGVGSSSTDRATGDEPLGDAGATSTSPPSTAGKSITGQTAERAPRAARAEGQTARAQPAPSSEVSKRGSAPREAPRRTAPGRGGGDPSRAREFAASADRHWAAGDFENALRMYEQAARHDPLEPRYQRQIGFANLSLGREANAVAPLRRYLQMAPQASDRAMIEEILRQHSRQ